MTKKQYDSLDVSRSLPVVTFYGKLYKVYVILRSSNKLMMLPAELDPDIVFMFSVSTIGLKTVSYKHCKLSKAGTVLYADR